MLSLIQIFYADKEEAVHVKHPSPDYHFKVGETRKPPLTTTLTTLPSLHLSYKACCCKLSGQSRPESGPQRQKCAQFTFMLRIFQNYPNHARNYYGEKRKRRLQVQCPCPVTQKGLFSKLPGRKINFSFPNVFETQSEDWLIENPDPFDQAAPGSSCQTICVISSDFCLRVK